MALADLRGEIHQLSAAIKRGRLADPSSVYFVLSTEVDSISLYQAVDNLFRTKYRRFAISLVTGIEHLRAEGDKALQSGVAYPPAGTNEDPINDLLQRLDRTEEILLLAPDRLTSDLLQELYDIGQYLNELKLNS